EQRAQPKTNGQRAKSQETAERYRRACAWSLQMIKDSAAADVVEGNASINADGFKKWTYPAAEFAKMYAPHEKVTPANKRRGLLKDKFALRRKDPANSFLHTAGAYDAMTASLLTELGFEAIYASGWQLAVAHNMYPDIGIYPSHQMVQLAYELV